MPHLQLTASGDDYTTNEEVSVTFSPLNTSTQCIQITVIGDVEREDDETILFSLSVTGPDRAGEVSSATLTIINDDGNTYIS